MNLDAPLTAVRPHIQPPLGRILLDRGLTGEADVAKALSFQANYGGLLGAILVRLGAVSEDAVLDALSFQLGIELIAAAQACDFHAPLSSSAPLEALRALVRREVPHLNDDRYFHPDIAAAANLVRSGAVIDAVGAVGLPSIERPAP